MAEKVKDPAVAEGSVGQKVKSTFREYAEAILMALVLALFIRTFIVQAFKIPSGSMIPTLAIGDHILVNKLSYGVRIPFLLPPEPRDSLRLLGCQAKVLPPDGVHPVVGSQAGEGGGRFATADEDRVSPFRELGQPVPENLVERGIGVDLLVIVEHDDERRGQAVEEIFEVPLREHA